MRRSSPVGQWWQYPLARPSWQFSVYNTYVRQLDVRYAMLPRGVRASWQSAAERWYWLAQCIPWIYEYDPLTREPSTGVAAYRSVNTSRLTQGMDVADTPPLTVTARDGDQLQPGTSDPFTVMWFGRPAPPTGDYYASVYATSMMHEPESGPSAQRLRFGFSSSISYEVALDLSPLRAALPGPCQMPWLAVGVVVSDVGSGPFLAARMGFPGPV